MVMPLSRWDISFVNFLLKFCPGPNLDTVCIDLFEGVSEIKPTTKSSKLYD